LISLSLFFFISSAWQGVFPSRILELLHLEMASFSASFSTQFNFLRRFKGQLFTAPTKRNSKERKRGTNSLRLMVRGQ
jgi:glycogen synthase